MNPDKLRELASRPRTISGSVTRPQSTSQSFPESSSETSTQSVFQWTTENSTQAIAETTPHLGTQEMPGSTTQRTTQSTFQSTSEVTIETMIPWIDKPSLRLCLTNFHLQRSTPAWASLHELCPLFTFTICCRTKADWHSAAPLSKANTVSTRKWSSAKLSEATQS